MATEASQRACKWRIDSTEYGDSLSWDTECDNKLEFMVEGPKENGYKYCPYCSGVISVNEGLNQP